MSLPALDISKYQGGWQDYPCDIVMIKMTGGDDGLYSDPDAGANFNGAVADGKAIGGYHFAGGTDPVAEANYFVNFTMPLTENQVYALDWEIQNPDPVGWCSSFMNQVHNSIGVWPLIYMNLSTLNAYDWSPVLSNCGLWLADWNNDPNGDVNTTHTFVMQQYSDGPVYDHDEWFGTIDEFNDYGWHASTPTPTPTPAPPTPTPTPSPTPTPVPVPTPPVPTPTPSPVPTPVPKPKPTPTPVPKPKPTPKPTEAWWQRLLRLLGL